jgi:hypothetical protein
VNGQGGDPALLGDLRNPHAIAVLRRPAGADLQGDRDSDRSDHRFQDPPDQPFVAQQRGACGAFADLLRWTTHVDVDDVGAQVDIDPGRFGHVERIRADDLR